MSPASRHASMRVKNASEPGSYRPSNRPWASPYRRHEQSGTQVSLPPITQGLLAPGAGDSGKQQVRLICRSTALRASSNGLIAAISSGRPAINSSARMAKTLNLARPMTRPRFLRRPRTWFSRSRFILTNIARLASSALTEWLSISWTSKPAGSADSAGTSSAGPAPGQQPGQRECPSQAQVRREGTACRYFHNERAMRVEAQARPLPCRCY